ncbi:hypothetical protein E4U51_006127 [Claviceps purpurea]|nr:hypothetical protein E4U51_006127 [Claviceps purpurea]
MACITINIFGRAEKPVLGAASVQRTSRLAIFGVFSTLGNGIAVAGTTFATSLEIVVMGLHTVAKVVPATAMPSPSVEKTPKMARRLVR